MSFLHAKPGDWVVVTRHRGLPFCEVGPSGQQTGQRLPKGGIIQLSDVETIFKDPPSNSEVQVVFGRNSQGQISLGNHEKANVRIIADAGGWVQVTRPRGLPFFKGSSPTGERVSSGSVIQLLDIQIETNPPGAPWLQGRTSQGTISLCDSRAHPHVKPASPPSHAALHVVSWNGASGDAKHSKNADVGALLADACVQGADIIVIPEFNVGECKVGRGCSDYENDPKYDFQLSLTAAGYANVDPEGVVPRPKAFTQYDTRKWKLFSEVVQQKYVLPGSPGARDGTVTFACLLPIDVGMLPLLVFAVHAGHNYDEPSKNTVVDELHKFINLKKQELQKSSLGSDECVVVVAGDFNEVGRNLAKGVLDPIPGGSTNWCGGEETHRLGNLDHIFFGIPYIVTTSPGRILTRFGSDHNALSLRAFPAMDDEAQVSAIFRWCDTNNDGKLSRAELINLLCRLDSLTWTPEKVNALLATVEEDRNHVIDYDEFVSWVFGKDK